MSVDKTSLERLSALVDDDLRGDDAGFVDRMVGDEDLRAAWRRYHLIGDCLRNEGSLVDDDFTAAMLRRLDEEPVVLAPGTLHRRDRQAPRPWYRAVAGTAIAAGVAAVIVVGVGRMQGPGTATAPAQVAQAPATQARTAEAAVSSDAAPAWDINKPEVASRLSRYIANHSDFASHGALNGMSPLATLVSNNE